MKFSHPNVSEILSNPINLLAFGLGSGLSPVAPGTFGTLIAVPLYLVLASHSTWIYITITMVLLISGIWICGRSARNLGVHDHSGIVLDEIVGFLIAMALVPVRWYWLLLGFVLFRLFDIIKPWPIRLIDQRVSGGTGIMLDDVIAGLFALLVLQGCIWVSGS